MAVPAAALTAAIVPKQNLHGYSFPWPGGAGKNKLLMTVSAIKAANTAGVWNDNTYTLDGVTFTILTDTDGNVTGIEIDGQPPSYGAAQFGIAFELAGDYIFNGVPSDAGGMSKIRAEFRTAIGGSTYAGSGVDTGSGANLSVATAETLYYNLRVDPTFDADHVVIRPMVRLSTESDTSFAPWENKCSISGIATITITTVNDDDTADVTIAFGQTVYGGTINFKTGELTITHTIYDMGDIAWDYFPTRQYFYAAFAGYGAPKPASGVLPNLISSLYKTVNTSNDTTFMDGKDGAISYYVPANAFQIVVKDTRYVDASALATALSGETVCFELATPTTVQLTPDILTMLKGDNSLSADSGDVITITAYVKTT